MEELIAAVGPISGATAARLARAEELRRHPTAGRFERREAEGQLDALLAEVQTSKL